MTNLPPSAVELPLRPLATPNSHALAACSGSCASITRDRERGILVTNVDGNLSFPESVTRAVACDIDKLIVRQLKRAQSDRMLLKVLPVASRLAKRVASS